MNVKTTIKHALRIIELIALGLVFFSVVASPGSAQGFTVSLQKPDFTVSPGDSRSGTIPVTNTSEETIVLQIYIEDWNPVPGNASDNAADEEGRGHERSMLDWIIFSPERMTLEPLSSQEVTFEVNVPDDPSLEGSYWGVLFIEAIPSEEPDISAPVGETTIGIRTVWRYAIKIFTSIEGTGIRDASFISINMEQAEGGFDAVAVFENKGNIHIRPEVWLEMTDIAGEVVYAEEHHEITVLPGSAREFKFELRNLPIESGEYLVMIYADYGVPTLIAAQGRVNLDITPPDPEEEEPVEVEEPEAEEPEPAPEVDTPTP